MMDELLSRKPRPGVGNVKLRLLTPTARGLTIGTEHAAGLDIHADVREPITIPGGDWAMISTGMSFELPLNWEAQIRSRSGLAAKKGVAVMNSPGTIDADYRGEIMVILINHGRYPFTVLDGDRIAQVVFAKVDRPNFVKVETISDTLRGMNGFGSTGTGKAIETPVG